MANCNNCGLQPPVFPGPSHNTTRINLSICAIYRLGPVCCNMYFTSLNCTGKTDEHILKFVCSLISQPSKTQPKKTPGVLNSCYCYCEHRRVAKLMFSWNTVRIPKNNILKAPEKKLTADCHNSTW